MNGKAILIDLCLGIYQVKIVNFDEGNAIERHFATCKREKAYEKAAEWNRETGLCVRIQHGPYVINIERRDQIRHKIQQS